MLEPWEKIVLSELNYAFFISVISTSAPPSVTIFVSLFILVLTGLFRYLPRHLVVMQRRAVYYLWGQEGDERLLWQWLGLGVSAGSGGSGPGLLKEL